MLITTPLQSEVEFETLTFALPSGDVSSKAEVPAANANTGASTQTGRMWCHWRNYHHFLTLIVMNDSFSPAARSSRVQFVKTVSRIPFDQSDEAADFHDLIVKLTVPLHFVKPPTPKMFSRTIRTIKIRDNLTEASHVAFFLTATRHASRHPQPQHLHLSPHQPPLQ